MQKNTDRINELDVLKGLAIIAVVVIHVIAQILLTYPINSLSFGISLTIDQLMRYAVPVFVAVSGYTLTIKYVNKKIELASFFKKRLFRVIPWYLIFSGIIYLFFMTTHWRGEWTQVLDPAWKIILFGGMDYHLYFVSMIVQMYLMYPVILYLFKKFRYILLLAAFGFQLIMYFFLSQSTLTDQQQYILSPTWIFYFILGIAFCFYNSSSQKQKKNLKGLSIIGLALGFIWALSEASAQIAGGIGINIATRSTKIATLVYSTFFISAYFLYAKTVQDYFQKLARVLTSLGQRSYITYLSHTIVLRTYMDYVQPKSLENAALLVILTLITSDAISQLCTTAEQWVFKKAPKKN